MTLATQLQATDLFHDVELADLEDLITRMEALSFPKGEALFQQGDAGDAMYIIQSGRVRISVRNRGDDDEVNLRYYEQHDIFGELSLLDHRPRSATASAAEDLQVLQLDREHFIAFLYERPKIGLAMMRSLSQRLRYTTDYLEQNQPKRFERPQVERGTQFRRAAKGQVADILDRVSAEDEHPTEPIELTGPVNVPYKAGQKPVDSDLDFEAARKVGGIFGKLADLEEERHKPNPSEPTDNS